MFGYISPDAPYLFKKDETLYKALYCGLCKGIGKGCGQSARTALSYDTAFMSALVHNIRGEDVTIKKQRCVAHFIKRRPVAIPDDTTIALGCVNTALAYFKLCDDKNDGDGRGLLRFIYKKGYKRALKRHPKIAEIISRNLALQGELESRGCAVIDEACEPTAQMMRELSSYLLGVYSTEWTEKLFYCIGKWVYLADALDDYDKDVKKNRYNVLYNVYGEKSKAEAVEKGGEEMTFVLDMLFAQMRECIANINFRFNHDLTDNIILRGIPLKSRKLFYGDCCNGGCKGEGKEKGKAEKGKNPQKI